MFTTSKLTSLISYVILVFLLVVGCSTEETPTYKIGFSQVSSSNPWRATMNKEMIREVSFNPQISLIIKDANNNADLQEKQIEAFLEEDIDLLIISPIDADKLKGVMPKVYKSKLPVIIAESNVNSDKYTAFIGGDNHELGASVGAYLTNLLSEGKILEIKGVEGSAPAEGRHKGFHKVLAGKDFQIDEIEGDWTREGTAEKFEIQIAEGNYDVIYGHNDEMALGAYDILKKYNKADSVQLFGVDGLAEGGMKAVAEGKLQASFIYPTEGDKVIDLAINILLGKKFEKHNALKTGIIDNSNVKMLTFQAEQLEYYSAKIKSQQSKFTNQLTLYDKQSAQLEMALTFLTIAVILGIVVIFLFFKIRSKKRTLEVKNIEIEQQKEEIQVQHEELIQQAEEIITQRDSLEEKNELLHQKNEQITTSIRYAQTIQKAILPSEDKLKTMFSDCFTYYKPRDIVSGDFYWATQIEEKRFITVADCTGHGVPGALMSMVGNSIFNKVIKERAIYQPSLILEQLDIEVRKVLQQEESGNDDGMDLALCVIESLKNEKVKVTFSGAKSNIMYSTKANSQKIEVLKGTRKAVGGLFMKKVMFKEQALELEKGDIIYFYTDGVTDQNNPQRVKFGFKKLFDILSDICDLSIKEQEDRFINTFEEYRNQQEQRDDITLMGIQL